MSLKYEKEFSFLVSKNGTNQSWSFPFPVFSNWNRMNSKLSLFFHMAEMKERSILLIYVRTQ